MLQITVLLKHHDIHNLTDIAVQEALALLNLKNLSAGSLRSRSHHRIDGEQTRRVTGRKQNTRTRTHRLTEDAGVLLQRADALLSTNSVLTVSMRTVRVQTRAANHHLKHRIVIPLAGPLHTKLKVLITIQETLNMVQVILSGGCHLAGNTHRIQVRGELIAAHRERH